MATTKAVDDLVEEYKKDCKIGFELLLVENGYDKEYADRMRERFEEQDWKQIFKREILDKNLN